MKISKRQRTGWSGPFCLALLGGLLFCSTFVFGPAYAAETLPSVTVTTVPADSAAPGAGRAPAQPGQEPRLSGDQSQGVPTVPPPSARPTRSQGRSQMLQGLVGQEVPGGQTAGQVQGLPSQQDQSAAEKTGTPPVNGGATPPSGQRRFQGGAVSFNFDDADVYSVIQTVFGDLLRVNYVVDPKVKGRVTFRSVAPVPRDNVLPVMEVILRLNGIGIVEEAGIFRIIQISDIAKEPAPIQFGRDPSKIAVTGKSLLQVVPILNIQSTEIVKLISSFMSANAVLIDVPRGNHLVIVDTDANVKRLLELVQIFDGEQFKKRKGEVYVYPIQNGKAKDVAVLLQQVFSTSGASGASGTSLVSSAPRPAGPTTAPTGAAPSQPAPSVSPTIVSGGTGVSLVSDLTRILYDERINAIVVVGTPEDYAIIKEAIEKIDVIPRQVVLEGIIAEVTLTDNLSLGMAYSLGFTANKFGLTGNIGLNPSELGATTTTTTTGTTTSFTGSGFTFMGVDQKGTVRALVTALATQSKGKLLAAPHILVADNQKARIQVGQQVPIVTSQTDYAISSGSTTQTVQYRDIGIILTVKPQVNEGGLVSLDLDQEISSYTTQKLYTGSDQIIIDKAQATTNLVVGDGQTIIIGGLIREDSTKSDSGIPFLHRIPVLGLLFGEKSKGSTRKEMVILLTPHVIKSQDQAREVTDRYINKFTDLGTVKKEELKDLGGTPKKP
jgi:type II secretory pathway component GspD/PulD (secretin)